MAIRDRCSEVDHSITSEVEYRSEIIRKCSVETIYSVALILVPGYSEHNKISEYWNGCMTSPARIGTFRLLIGTPHLNHDIHARI